VSSAFDLSRAFLYRWTVNWRFISEDVFLSAAFARTLLFLHLSLLALLAVRLCAPHGGLVAVTARAVRRPRAPTALAALPGRTIVTSLCVANLIGITCARSLHYQFYAWYAPQTVYLAWQTRFPTVLRCVGFVCRLQLAGNLRGRLLILATIEYAWNVYPSTSASSGTLLVAHGLLIAGVLDGLHVMRRLQP
jgi:alpha-1,3-mannosyltransferase